MPLGPACAHMGLGDYLHALLPMHHCLPRHVNHAQVHRDMLACARLHEQVSKEDFKDVIGLLPENTPLPASDKMTYLLARLEVCVRGR